MSLSKYWLSDGWYTRAKPCHCPNTDYQTDDTLDNSRRIDISPHFRNACTKSGSLRFSQFSGCWLILSVYIIMSFDFSFVRLLGVRVFSIIIRLQNIRENWNDNIKNVKMNYVGNSGHAGTERKETNRSFRIQKQI
jgi:hypothetical protein